MRQNIRGMGWIHLYADVESEFTDLWLSYQIAAISTIGQDFVYFSLFGQSESFIFILFLKTFLSFMVLASKKLHYNISIGFTPLLFVYFWLSSTKENKVLGFHKSWRLEI